VPFTVVYDANVLYPSSLRDTLLRLAHHELYDLVLSERILDEATRNRAAINPLRVLDDKRPDVRALLDDAPLLVDHLSAASAEHHAAVKQHLDDLGVAYVENPRMVRGLDYYTKTTFEFVHDGLGAQSGIGGGGRYDGLMATLGGQPLSGVGYGIGVDRTLLACRAEGTAPWSEARCEVFGVPLGDAAKRLGRPPVVALTASPAGRGGPARSALVSTTVCGTSPASAMKRSKRRSFGFGSGSTTRARSTLAARTWAAVAVPAARRTITPARS